MGALATINATILDTGSHTTLRLESGSTIQIPPLVGVPSGTEIILQVCTADQIKAKNQDMARAFLQAIITAS